MNLGGLFKDQEKIDEETAQTKKKTDAMSKKLALDVMPTSGKAAVYRSNVALRGDANLARWSTQVRTTRATRSTTPCGWVGTAGSGSSAQ